MKNKIIKFLGLNALVFFGDPTTFDRFVWLKRHLRGGPLRTLDAGCGSGTFTFYAAKIRNKALGISYDSRNTEVAKVRAKILGIDNVRFLEWDLRALSEITSTLGHFDQIICFETIEHIKEDRKLVSNLSVLLNPGGRLILTVPYKHYHHLLGDKLSEEEDGGHVRWGYTHEDIRNIFVKCNLDVEVEEYVSGIVSQQICNLQRILSFINDNFAWFVVFPLRLFQFLDRPLTYIFNYPYLSIGVVGVKEKN